MDEPIKIEKITQTSFACPSQWDMISINGDNVYVRYRSGLLRIDLNGKTIYKKLIGDNADGYMSLEELEVFAHGVLDLTQESEEMVPA